MALKRGAKNRNRDSRGGLSRSAPAPIVNIADYRTRRDALQPNRKPGIFLACPTGDGYVNFTIAMMLGKLMAYSHDPSCPFTFTIHTEVQRRPIDHARNCIVKKFMEDSNDDWLVMIDADQYIPDNWWNLCTVQDADVVGALTPVWVGNMSPETMLRVNSYGINEKNQCYNLPMPDDKVKAPYRVPVVGTGLIAIRRRVFAPKPHGVGQNPFYFTFEDNRKVRGGEDVNFSVECNRAGFVLAVHPGVRSDHLKELPLFEIDRYYHARREFEKSGRQLTPEQRLSIG